MRWNKTFEIKGWLAIIVFVALIALFSVFLHYDQGFQAFIEKKAIDMTIGEAFAIGVLLALVAGRGNDRNE